MLCTGSNPAFCGGDRPETGKVTNTPKARIVILFIDMTSFHPNPEKAFLEFRFWEARVVAGGEL